MKLSDESMPTGDIYDAPELSPEELAYLQIKLEPLGHLIDVMKTKGSHTHRQPVPVSEMSRVCTAYAADIRPGTRLTVITYNDLFRGVAWSVNRNNEILIAHLFGNGPDVRFRMDAEIQNTRLRNMAIYGVHAPVVADIRQGSILMTEVEVPAEEMVVFMGCVAHSDVGYIFGANVLPPEPRRR